MRIESLPPEVLDVVLNNTGLSAYLSNLQKGRAATPRSWLYENESDTEVLSRWLDILTKYSKTSAPHSQLVFQFDTSQLKKFGPQGKVPPLQECMDLVTEGFAQAGAPCPKAFRSPLWNRAKRIAAERLFQKTGLWHTLRPRGLEAVVDNMASRDTLESNSGFPLFTRRKNESVTRQALDDARSGAWRAQPAILLFRNYNQKTRPVWMYPMATNLVEGSFAQPLKEALTNAVSFFTPWKGYDAVREQLTEVYNSGEFLSASDFSHTDAYYTKWQMLETFDVIKHAFQPQYWDALKESMLRVCSIPLIIGPDQWITGDHGVSSGSNWTNDVETYLDYVAEIYLELLGFVASPLNAIGDDVIHRLKKFMATFANRVAKVYKSLGFDVNAEKVTNQQNWVKYLQRLSIRGFFRNIDYAGLSQHEKEQLRGIYSTIRALNSSLNPEKFHKPEKWSAEMFCCRQFMILENCIDHPLFVEFVKFICAGNAHLIRFAKQTAAQIDKAYRLSRLLPGLNPTYNQEKRDSRMSSFASIAIARKL